jgi:hypothetical protein
MLNIYTPLSAYAVWHFINLLSSWVYVRTRIQISSLKERTSDEKKITLFSLDICFCPELVAAPNRVTPAVYACRVVQSIGPTILLKDLRDTCLCLHVLKRLCVSSLTALILFLASTSYREVSCWLQNALTPRIAHCSTPGLSAVWNCTEHLFSWERCRLRWSVFYLSAIIKEVTNSIKPKWILEIL